MIEIKDVSIKFGSVKIFENFNLEIDDNKITALIAPSGTGKSTLFNAMLGLQKYEGTILYEGIELTNKKMYANISYMPQEDGLYEYLTGYENFIFFMKLNKQLFKTDDVNALFADFDLLYAVNKKVAEYSGGMKKKLSLMIALSKPSKYIYLDEPTVGIDPVQKEEFWHKLKKIACEGNKTIIVTTHVMDEASRCDKIVFVREGRVIANDTEEKILKELAVDNLNEAFIKLVKGGF